VRRRATTFAALGALTTAAAGLAAAVPVVLAGLPVGWAAAGWLGVSAVSLPGGVVLAASHGHTGSRFLSALAATTAARGATLVVGLVLSLRAGGGAEVAFLVGFAAAFVALVAFEWIWFQRAARVAIPVAPGAEESVG
jgi:hypothetical protein